MDLLNPLNPASPLSPLNPANPLNPLNTPSEDSIAKNDIQGGLTTGITPEVLLYMGVTVLIIGLIIVIYLWLDRGRG